MFRRLKVGVGLALVASCAAWGQDFSRVEVFGGYSYGNFGATRAFEGRNSVNGFNAAVTVNVNRWAGLVSDFSGHYGDSSSTIPLPPILCPPGTACVSTARGADRYHNFLFGPQFTLRKDKVAPFLHALIGGSHFNETRITTIVLPPPGIPPVFRFSVSSTNFAFATGGGVDYKLTERIAWRVQADYLQTQINRRTQNDLRTSTGLAFHF